MSDAEHIEIYNLGPPRAQENGNEKKTRICVSQKREGSSFRNNVDQPWKAVQRWEQKKEERKREEKRNADWEEREERKRKESRRREKKRMQSGREKEGKGMQPGREERRRKGKREEECRLEDDHLKNA